MTGNIPTPDYYRAESPEVFYSTEEVVTASAEDIVFLKQQAAANPRLRCRLCSHPEPGASLHGMLIVHHHDVYVRPHLHVGKSETLQVIEGQVRAVMFSKEGNIRDVIEMGKPGSRWRFFYRMPEGVYHTLLVQSEWLVFAESTTGPFDPSKTVFPDWAPDGADEEAADRYLADLRKASEAFLREPS